MITILNIIHVIIRPANNFIFLNLARRLEKLPTPVLEPCVLSSGMTQQNNPEEKIAIGVNAGGRTNYETKIVRLQEKVTFLPGVFMR